MALAEVRAGITAALVLGVAGAGGACNLPEQPTRLPSRPSVQSFNVDVTFFSMQGPDTTAPNANWAVAVDRVGYIDSIVEGFFQVPRATLQAIADVLATRSGGSWRWAYSATIEGHGYSGYLRGAGIGGTDEWALVVNAPSLTPALNNYLWLEGVSAAGLNFGVWFIYQPAFTGPQESVRVDWTVSTSTTRSIVLRRVGSTMNYQLGFTTGSIVYTASTPEESFTLNWNHQTGDGRVAIGFGPPQCWDAQQHDAACS